MHFLPSRFSLVFFPIIGVFFSLLLFFGGINKVVQAQNTASQVFDNTALNFSKTTVLPPLTQEDVGIRVNLRGVQPIYSFGQSILIEIEIINYSQNRGAYRFLVYDNPFEQIKLYCLDEYGNTVFPTASYESWSYMQRSQDLDVRDKNLADLISPRKVREVELSYGQTFKMTVDLRDYFEIQREGKYFVSADFFPASLENSDYFFSSMQDQIDLRLGEVQPLLGRPRKVERPTFLDEITLPSIALRDDDGQASARYPVSPTGVVQWNLKNQQEKNWRDFLLAFKFDELLTNAYLSTDYYERFRAASDAEVPIIIDDFSRFLVDSIDYEVLRFEPRKTMIVGDEAEVEIIVDSVETYLREEEVFNPLTGQVELQWNSLQDGVLERTRIFIYSLRRIDNVWKIVSIDTRVSDGNVLEKKQEQPAAPAREVERIGFVYFAFNQAIVREEYFTILDRIVNIVLDNPDIQISLAGYADDLGSDAYNLTLSGNRVDAVAAYLVQRGVEPTRIVKDPRGEINVGVATPTAELRQQNRRVEISFFR